jgi:hypothetical protein
VAEGERVAEEVKQTLFEAEVRRLMSSRGLRNWGELSSRVAEHGYMGYEVFAPDNRGWVDGFTPPISIAFGRALAKALELTEEERSDFAYAFLFGQGTIA